MPTNLQLTLKNLCRSEGYFYQIDPTADVLYRKVDNGSNSYSYPLDSDIENEVQCIQFDKTYFYTLENVTSANSNNGKLLFKKWQIDNFVLRLKRTYTLNGNSTQKYDCQSFAVECFSREIATTATAGSNSITLDDADRLKIGDVLNLGPSTFSGDEGLTEAVTVLSIAGDVVTLTTTLVNSYNTTDAVNWGTRIWFFNKFRQSDSDPTNGSGELFSFDLNPLTTTVTARKSSNEFRNVLASAFIRDPYYSGGAREFLAFMSQTNLLFIETDPDDADFKNTIQSSAQDNQETTAVVIPVYAITHEGSTVFRLQQKATYRTDSTTSTEDWGSQFNYQVATLQRIPFSISMTAEPSVIPADTVSTSEITALIKDQFDEVISGRTVSFTDSDSSGTQGVMNPTSASTNSLGKATVDYRAGSTARTVTITASS